MSDVSLDFSLSEVRNSLPQQDFGSSDLSCGHFTRTISVLMQQVEELTDLYFLSDFIWMPELFSSCHGLIFISPLYHGCDRVRH